MAQANATQAIANIYKTPELWQKITFTFICLVIYRVGSHVAAPGVDVQAMIDYFSQQNKSGGGLLGLYDLFVGGNLSRATIFALGIMPYISASIFAQIGAAVIPTLDKMQKDEEGRNKITQWTRYATIALAIAQGWGFALFTESVQGAAQTPGLGFKIQMTFVLTTGAIFVMWLGEQITERGLGNGASLMIFFSIVERFWPAIGDTYRFYTTGATNLLALIALLFLMVGVVAAVVVITIAARRIAIQIPQRSMARGRMREAAKNFIPLRINAAGVMPIIFASSLVVVPGAFAQFSSSEFWKTVADYMMPGTWAYFWLMSVLIMFFTYFYTSIIFNPVDLAENLKKQGGFIPGIKPGAKTADYIDHVVMRITLPGAIFLTLIAMLPMWIGSFINVNFRFGGTSLLIVVGVALDTLAQMQQHLLLRKYDGFMKKGRVRFRGRSGF